MGAGSRRRRGAGDPVTITEDVPLDEVVRIMERRRVKRLPVVRVGDTVVGIVSRANLLHALASLVPRSAGRHRWMGRPDPPAADRRALNRQPWAPIALIDIVVKGGVVELWGTITEVRSRARP